MKKLVPTAKVRASGHVECALESSGKYRESADIGHRAARVHCAIDSVGLGRTKAGNDLLQQRVRETRRSASITRTLKAKNSNRK